MLNDELPALDTIMRNIGATNPDYGVDLDVVQDVVMNHEVVVVASEYMLRLSRKPSS